MDSIWIAACRNSGKENPLQKLYLIMYELDDPKYLYLLGIIPVLLLLFLFNLYWKRKKQREFGDFRLKARDGSEITYRCTSCQTDTAQKDIRG